VAKIPPAALPLAYERAKAALERRTAASGDWTHWLPANPDGSPGLPQDKQRAFLDLTCLEAMYGGAAGGGKTSALLMAALQYVHVPGYAALILRKTYADLALPGAIMDRAISWWVPKGVHWNAQDKRFTFPSGATITFGYLDNAQDRWRYQGMECQTVIFDEVTQFPIIPYTYLFSRLRKLKGVDIPLRMRSASNPGGIGHDWVRRRFVESTDPNCVFVPALLSDNRFVDAESYLQALAQLDPVTRKQLLEGIWIRDSAGLVYARFDEARNLIDVLPRSPNGTPQKPLDRYIIGIDYGYTDATAFSVLGWIEKDKTVYVVEAWKETGLTPSDAAERVKALSERYQPDKIVGDIGGLGKGYVEEARKRFGLPIEAAEKHNKRGYIDLLNGALAEGRLKLLRGTTKQLVTEWLELPWAKGHKRDAAEGTIAEAEGFENHVADSCFIAGTIIETEHGGRPIESIRAGDIVWTRQGLKPVIQARCAGLKSLWQMGSLVGTAEHPIWTEGGWRPLYKVESSSILLAWENTANVYGWNTTESFTEDIRILRNGTTGSIGTVAEPTGNALGYIGFFGKRQTVRSRQSTTFITKTITRLTTIWRTWNVFWDPSISESTRENPNESRPPRRAYTGQSLLPPRGTDLRKGRLGMPNTGSFLGKIARCASMFARSVETVFNLEQPFLMSAGALVLPRSVEPAGKTTKPDSVSSAAATIGPTNTEKASFVRCRATRAIPTGNAALVYNLQVQDAEEYVANGVLVHNCLYGFRACLAYTEEPDEVLPDVNTQAYYDRMERHIEQEMEDRCEKNKTREWWEQ
jgi:hypothetical protein